jgi:hypothetical protein
MSERTVNLYRDALLLALVAIGVGLRIWQYLSNTSLWVDEIFLSSNILHRPVRELLVNPLSYGQVAPKGFLFLVKLATLTLGRSDYVLRLVPVLASLVGLLAFWRIVRRWLPGAAGPIALTLYSTAAPLITFGSLVKQYSLDVAAAVVLLWISLSLVGREISPQRALGVATVGAAMVWFSQPAVIEILALGAALTLICWSGPGNTRARRFRSLIPILVTWIVSALAAAAISIAAITPATREFMHQYWAPGFLPSPPWRAIEIRWPWNELKAVVGSGGQASLAYPHPGFYLLLAASGFWLLWRRMGSGVALFVAPIAAMIGAGIVRQYPFSDRLILFLLPYLFIGTAASVGWIYLKVFSRSKYVGWVVVAAIVGPAVYPTIAIPPPYRVEDMKPVMAHLRANKHPGDVVYVFDGARLAFSFYSREYGFNEDDYIVGGCHRGDNRSYFEELDAFRGKPRIWVVLTHALASLKERDDIQHYLDTIGDRRDEFVVRSRVVSHWALPAEVWMYDLSDSRRLSNASAASISLLGNSSPNAMTGCGQDPQVLVPPRGY